MHTLGLLLKKDTPIDIPQNLQEVTTPYNKVCLNVWFDREKGWITDCWVDGKKILLTVPKRSCLIFDLDEKIIRLGPYVSKKMGAGEIKLIECLYNNKGNVNYEKLETYIKGSAPDQTDRTNNMRGRRKDINDKLSKLFENFKTTTQEMLPYDNQEKLQQLNLDLVEVYGENLKIQYDISEFLQKACEYAQKARKGRKLWFFEKALISLEFLIFTLAEDGNIKIDYCEAVKCLLLYSGIISEMEGLISNHDIEPFLQFRKEEVSKTPDKQQEELIVRLRHALSFFGSMVEEITGHNDLHKKCAVVKKALMSEDDEFVERFSMWMVGKADEEIDNWLLDFQEELL